MTVKEEIIEYVTEMIKMFGSGKVLETNEIKRAVNLKYERNKGSIIPSDYCYNLVNKGKVLKNPTLFIHIDDGQYECVGLNYPYNGVILHRPKGENAEIPVGKCVNGKRIINDNFNF